MAERTHEAESTSGDPPDAWLGLGSNMGHRAGMLARALDALAAQEGLELLATSSVYETDPVGVTDQPEFLNMVARFRCTLSPEGLLHAMRVVERQLGRVRVRRWGPRTIDIDLLLLGELEIATAELTVPHPELTKRQFVLVPLAEIAPALPLPGGHSAAEMADMNSGAVRRIGALEEVLRREG